MAVNPYTSNSRSKSVTPWSTEIVLASVSKGPAGLFDLYNSLGDKTYTGALTHTLLTTTDGPDKVFRFGALTVGDGTNATILTASQRCKGLTILCDSLTVRTNASLNMTGKGPRVLTNDDPYFPFIDYYIPFSIVLTSSCLSVKNALALIKASGFAPWDQGTWQHVVSPMFGLTWSIGTQGSCRLMQGSEGAMPAGGAPVSSSGYSAYGNTGGSNTAAGTPGAGASGGAATRDENHTGYAYSTAGCKPSPYGGGSGGGACNSYDSSVSNTPPWPYSSNRPYSGPGGNGGGAYPASAGAGAGLPPGSGYSVSSANEGVGGKMTIICRGTVTVESGGKIEANGMPGSHSGYAAGGGSGGGHISIISPAYCVPAGTIQCAGGGSVAIGGAGSYVKKTFAEMGWA